jgi:hypothetical protein
MANLSPEATQIAYSSGVRALGPLAQRVIELETAVALLHETNKSWVGIVEGFQQRIAALETAARNSAPPHLRNAERR